MNGSNSNGRLNGVNSINARLPTAGSEVPFDTTFTRATNANILAAENIMKPQSNATNTPNTPKPIVTAPVSLRSLVPAPAPAPAPGGNTTHNASASSNKEDDDYHERSKNFKKMPSVVPSPAPAPAALGASVPAALGTGTKNTRVNLVKLIEDLKSHPDDSDDQYKIIAEKLLTELKSNFSKDFSIKILLEDVLDNCIDFLQNTEVDEKLSAVTNFANTFDEFYNEFYDASSKIFKYSRKDEIEKFMKLYSEPIETFLKSFIEVKLTYFYGYLPSEKHDYKILTKLAKRDDYLPGPMIYQKYKTEPVPIYFNVANGKFKVSIPKATGVKGAPLEICSYSLKGIRDVLIQDATIKTESSAYGKFKRLFSTSGGKRTARRGGRRLRQSNKTRRNHK